MGEHELEVNLRTGGVRNPFVVIQCWRQLNKIICDPKEGLCGGLCLYRRS